MNSKSNNEECAIIHQNNTCDATTEGQQDKPDKVISNFTTCKKMREDGRHRETDPAIFRKAQIVVPEVLG